MLNEFIIKALIFLPITLTFVSANDKMAAELIEKVSIKNEAELKDKGFLAQNTEGVLKNL